MREVTISLGFLIWTVCLLPVAADEPAKAKGGAAKVSADAAASFDRLKTLVGDWRLASRPEEASNGKVAVRYRLTAGGSALVETLFPGEEKEMVTVYHRDGDRLTLTHYCCCGNQPKMSAKAGGDRDELVFDFAGGSNLDPAKDMHMHRYRLRFVDADHIHGEWEYYDGGKAAGTHIFDLTRAKS
jgi:hypothetical protein